jgi:hypothetical protein
VFWTTDAGKEGAGLYKVQDGVSHLLYQGIFHCMTVVHLCQRLTQRFSCLEASFVPTLFCVSQILVSGNVVVTWDFYPSLYAFITLVPGIFMGAKKVVPYSTAIFCVLQNTGMVLRSIFQLLPKK